MGGTQGTTDLASAKMHLGHAHRLAQSRFVTIQVKRAPVYMQIDGEGWYLDKECTLRIRLHDQLNTLIGYKEPRGVRKEYSMENYTDKIKQERHRFRDRVRMRYNIPTRFSRNYGYTDISRKGRSRKKRKGWKNKSKINRQNSTDDFDLNLHTSGNDEHKRSKSTGTSLVANNLPNLLLTPARSSGKPGKRGRQKKEQKRWSLKMGPLIRSKSRDKVDGKDKKGRRKSLF